MKGGVFTWRLLLEYIEYKHKQYTKLKVISQRFQIYNRILDMYNIYRAMTIQRSNTDPDFSFPITFWFGDLILGLCTQNTRHVLEVWKYTIHRIKDKLL